MGVNSILPSRTELQSVLRPQFSRRQGLNLSHFSISPTPCSLCNVWCHSFGKGTLVCVICYLSICWDTLQPVWASAISPGSTLLSWSAPACRLLLKAFDTSLVAQETLSFSCALCGLGSLSAAVESLCCFWLAQRPFSTPCLAHGNPWRLRWSTCRHPDCSASPLASWWETHGPCFLP